MHFERLALFSSLLFCGSQAWLPGEHRQILSRDGVDLFNRSSLHEAELLTKRYLPGNYGNDKNAIRGVNLGSLFIVENWLSDDVFKRFNCNNKSEFDCVSSINNQATANSLFQDHWQNWISQSDFQTMVSYGLNTVRIPVGYWFLESIVDQSEHFPQGGEHYLDQVVGWAKDAGLYVIIVLHGAPGAQATDAFTGQYNTNPGFYNDYNYNRAYEWLQWMTNKVHTNAAYSTVGMLELVNEPERVFDGQYPNAQANTDSMRQTYYTTAWSKIRDTESSLNVPSSSLLSIQMMDQKWGSGDPKQYLSDLYLAAYDDHQYVKYAGVAVDKDAYVSFSCGDNRSGNWPVFVGEWSLSVDTGVQWNDDWNPFKDENKDFYRKWWAAQVMSYEQTAQGWVFWTWQTSGSLGDPRWDYKMAVANGIIPTDIDSAYTMGACN